VHLAGNWWQVATTGTTTQQYISHKNADAPLFTQVPLGSFVVSWHIWLVGRLDNWAPPSRASHCCSVIGDAQPYGEEESKNSNVKASQVHHD